MAKAAFPRVTLVFVLVILLLSTLTIYSYQKIQYLINVSEKVDYTNIIKLELERSISFLKDAETGQRAYLLSGDKIFLSPFQLSFDNTNNSLAKLDSLVADNPVQVSNMKRLHNLVKNRMDFLELLIANKQASLPLTNEQLTEGAILMDAARDLIEKMMIEEERLLKIRKSSFREQSSITPIWSLVLMGFSILVLSLSYVRILRELRISRAFQQSLEKRTAELKQANEILGNANAELSQFAYVASHDLQEPLRKIQTFISRIDDSASGLPERSRKYFEGIQSAAIRMRQLILDILSYSRANNTENNFEETDLNKIAAAAVDSLSEMISQKHATVHYISLPVIHGIPFQLEQIFTNLISNALKFSAKNRLPVINISAQNYKSGKADISTGIEEGIYHCIDFADNGIGFDPQFSEHIFGVFKRLHSRDAYAGTGIGLAIVKKNMDNHHGYIKAKGEADKGATFSLYFPAKELKV